MTEGCMMEIPDWILQTPPAQQPTELLIPVNIAVVPVMNYVGGGEGWQAELVTSSIPECPHHHKTADEAFACGQRLARDLAYATIAALEEKVTDE